MDNQNGGGLPLVHVFPFAKPDFESVWFKGWMLFVPCGVKHLCI